MSDITPQKVLGHFAIRTIDDLSRLSAMLAKSGYFSDSKEAAQCGVKVLAGLELGFPTIASMCGIHIINGKPTLGAHLMAAAVKRSGKYNYRVTQHDNNGCVIAFYENGEMIGESSFTKQDTIAAGALDGKNAHTWKKFPRNMMFARAMSNGVRWYCPDIFTGTVVYTPDELDEATDSEGNLVQSVSVKAAVEEPFQQKIPQSTNSSHPHNERVRGVRTLLGIDGKAVLELLKTEMLVNSPAELDLNQVDELIESMAVQWAVKQGMQHNHAFNSFRKHIPAIIQEGYTEVDALKLWMEHVQQQAEQKLSMSVG
ncbi:MAG: hypothetical protein PUP92_33630 [Rhizonema sp. PD38]|nr:hypothetical protein [Rhizonema sp. PD38]